MTTEAVICCRWCRETDRNELLFSNNHGGEHGIHWGICIAQYLLRNHVRYYVAQLDGTDARQKLNDVEQARAHLAERIERATQLWAHMDDTEWLDHARTVLAESAPPAAPDHHAVKAADQGGLW